MKKKIALSLSFNLLLFTFVYSQPDRWQQRVKYTINADVDVNTNLINGAENLEYANNSPDKLDQCFFSFVLECVSARK